MTNRRTGRLAWTCLALGLASLTTCVGLLAQQAPFRAGVELVALDVTVLDSRRRPVTGLAAADFRVTVDGRDVPIASFAAVTGATAVDDAGTPRPNAGPGAVPAASADAAGDSGRVLILLFDRSIPAGEPTTRARSIARAVVESAGADDHIAIVRSSGFSGEGASVEPTRDRQALLAEIDAPFTGMVAVPQMSSSGLQARPPDLFLTGDCLCGVCVFDALEHVARAVEHESRKKMLFFIGSDIVVQERPSDPTQCQPAIRDGRTRMLRALDAANLTVHAFDTLGIQSLASGAQTSAADALPGGNLGRPAMSRNLERHGNLAVLPDFTGGRTVLNTNTPEAAVPDVLAETSSYYVIGIERDAAVDPRKVRAVRVRVDRRGLTVRSRTGYFGRQ